jgi:hypothetical protein
MCRSGTRTYTVVPSANTRKIESEISGDTSPGLIRRRLLDVVDDEHVHRGPGGFQLQAKLLSDRGENRGTVGVNVHAVDSNRLIRRCAGPTWRQPIRRPREIDVVVPPSPVRSTTIRLSDGERYRAMTGIGAAISVNRPNPLLMDPHLGGPPGAESIGGDPRRPVNDLIILQLIGGSNHHAQRNISHRESSARFGHHRAGRDLVRLVRHLNFYILIDPRRGHARARRRIDCLRFEAYSPRRQGHSLRRRNSYRRRHSSRRCGTSRRRHFSRGLIPFAGSFPSAAYFRSADQAVGSAS